MLKVLQFRASNKEFNEFMGFPACVYEWVFKGLARCLLHGSNFTTESYFLLYKMWIAFREFWVFMPDVGQKKCKISQWKFFAGENG